MFKKAMQVLVVIMAFLILCIGFFCFGAVWWSTHSNGNDATFDTKPTPTCTVAPVLESVTATPLLPVAVVTTAMPTPVCNVESVHLYVDSEGYLFAFEDKYIADVKKAVNVNKAANELKLKNGRVYTPNRAWLKNAIPVEAIVDNVIVKNVKLYTTACKIVEKTVMKSTFGYAHRIFDENKKGEIVAVIIITFAEKEYELEVWYQQDEYTLRVHGERKNELTPTLPTATPRIPTDEPTATPRIPMDDPTATPRIPMDDPTATPRIPMDDPTATPRIPIDDATATPRIPMDDPTATPYIPMDDATATPRIPIDDATATPYIIPMDDPTATPRIPMDDPTATPYIPMDDPTATPRIPIDDATATPYIPMDDATATPYIPMDDATATPYIPMYD